MSNEKETQIILDLLEDLLCLGDWRLAYRFEYGDSEWIKVKDE